MDFNFLIFPVPESSYTAEEYSNELLYIPRSPDKIFGYSNSDIPIPCLYLPYLSGSSKILIYFHGNAEDLGLAYELLDHLRNNLKIHVLAIEFPGYGIYPGKPSAEAILEDSLSVWEYLTSRVGLKPSDIILFGRSLGTGPATELAAYVKPCALMLMSAYLSIRQLVRNIAGSLASFLVYERFRNMDNIKLVKCPTFLIHGKKDLLIPFEHS